MATFRKIHMIFSAVITAGNIHLGNLLMACAGGYIQPMGSGKEMKLCINCRWFKYAACYHEKSIRRIELIHGIVFRHSPETMRDDDELCGKEGILFESKPPKISLRVRLAYRLIRWL